MRRGFSGLNLSYTRHPNAANPNGQRQAIPTAQCKIDKAAHLGGAAQQSRLETPCRTTARGRYLVVNTIMGGQRAPAQQVSLNRRGGQFAPAPAIDAKILPGMLAAANTTAP